mgnify:CR=1 FL=1
MAIQLISQINNSGLYAQVAASALNDENGQSITATYAKKIELNNKLDTTAFSTVSGDFVKTTAISDMATKTWTTTNFQGKLTAGDNIDITSNVISVTGLDGVYAKTSYVDAQDKASSAAAVTSAKNWITEQNYLQDDDISGKLDTSAISSVSSQWNAAYVNQTANSAHWENTYNTVSSRSAQWSEGKAYLAGPNINIDSDYRISGRDWQPEIDTASADLRDDIDEISGYVVKTSGVNNLSGTYTLSSTNDTVTLKDGIISGTSQNGDYSFKSDANGVPQITQTYSDGDSNYYSQLAPDEIAITKDGTGVSITPDDITIDGKSITSELDDIKSLIPDEATSANKLADKAYVDTSVEQNAAKYLTMTQGTPFDTYADLTAATSYWYGSESGVSATKNDYTIVTNDETHSGSVTRYVYQNGSWNFQYVVDNSPMTPEQLAALNSTITLAKVQNYDSTSATVNTNSANWNKTFTAVTSNSSNWNDVTAKVDTTAYNLDKENWNETYGVVSYNSATWNTVSAKLNASESANFVQTTAMTAYYKKTETSGADEIANALTAKQDKLTDAQLSAISCVSSKLDTTAFSTVSGTFLTDADLEDYYTTAQTYSKDEVDYLLDNKQDKLTTAQLSAISCVSSKLDTTAFSTVSGDFVNVTALDNYYLKTETSSKEELTTEFNTKQDTLSFTYISVG